MARLGHFVYRRRRFILLGTLVVVVLAGVFGGKVADHLKAGGFDSPDVESQRAAALLGTEFHQSPPNFLLLITARTGTVSDAAVRAAGSQISSELAHTPG